MAPQWLTGLLGQVPQGTGRASRIGRTGRRTRQRVERYFECNWVSPWGEEESRVRSISKTGCYIDSRLSVPPEGTWIRDLRVALPTGCIKVEGMVLEATPGIGFAVRFTSVDDEASARLSDLVAARG